MNKTERNVRVDGEEEDCGRGDEEFWPLSEKKPFFNVIMSKSHVKPICILALPLRIHSKLPCETTIPTLLKYRGKTWKATYHGGNHHSPSPKRLDSNSWRQFVSDNDLKVGDGCVFQLLHSSSSKLVFRVQILRGDIPSAFLRRTSGETAHTPILLLD
nr:B3 domain-containing protein Os04g0386900-like [Ziziphus jujuba var. spinosa]